MRNEEQYSYFFERDRELLAPLFLDRFSLEIARERIERSPSLRVDGSE